MGKLTAVVFSLFFTLTASGYPFKASRIAMSAAGADAVRAGQKIAEAGGNVIDVAITMTLTMAVTHPSFAALGGGGFAVMRVKGKTEVLDFREVAPAGTGEDYFVKRGKNASTVGGTAVAVPGLPAGLWALHNKYGKIHWSRLFDEPIRLAESGFRVSGDWYEDYLRIEKNLNAAGKRHFRKPNGARYKPGDLLVQKGLAKALKEMRNRNIVSFYNGDVARDIVATVKASGGDMTLKDLQSYKPVWREPLVTKYNGYKLYLMPPPSSGGYVIKTALELADRVNAKKLEPLSAEEFHVLGQILSRSFRGRTLLGDPDFQTIPVDRVFSDKVLDELAGSIDKEKATTLSAVNETQEKEESTETTHLSVLDAEGNAVAMTMTLNGSFGSGVVTEKYGIALNNEMDDFTTKPGQPNMFGLIQGSANHVKPGKRPLSSMSPTLVERNGKIVLAIGAPGGPRIISSVFQTLYRMLTHDWTVEDAMLAPRVHHQFLPDKLFIDRNRMSPSIVEDLKKRGNTVELGWMAKIYAVHLNDGLLEAIYDIRGEGAAAGF